MLRVGALGLFIALTLLWVPPASACKCAEPPGASDALKAAAAVFEGRVTKLTPLNELELLVELDVVRTWKDAGSEQITLRTRKDSAACGYPFVVDESFLVYATETPAGLQALHCGRTKSMTEADADIAELGMGVVPVAPHKHDLPPGAEPPTQVAAQARKPAAGGCASCSSVGHRRHTGLDVPAVLLLLLVVAWRVRRLTRRCGRGSAAISRTLSP